MILPLGSIAWSRLIAKYSWANESAHSHAKGALQDSPENETGIVMNAPSIRVQHLIFVLDAMKGSFAVMQEGDIGELHHSARKFTSRFKHRRKIAHRPNSRPGCRLFTKRGDARGSGRVHIISRHIHIDACRNGFYVVFVHPGLDFTPLFFALWCTRSLALFLVLLSPILIISDVSSLDPPVPNHEADDWDYWIIWCMSSCL